ncbi:gamma-glutamyl-gamma-aminobutyrate hydrolase family protein [Crystallibacter crystallopoietes]|nr:gamma-glutamyl-gamma-aminobutyrate hydrolase family protein [Arthrobacter crystallopoietes]
MNPAAPGTDAMGNNDGGRPRIAVSYAHRAASQPEWFSDELADLARHAVAGLDAVGADAVVIDSASGHVFSAVDFDGVLVLGGGDVDPSRYGGNTGEPTVHGVDTRADETEIDLVIGAVENGRPVLGICRGLQLINVAFAGSLIEDLGPDSVHKVHQERPPMIGHTVTVEPGTLLADALGAGEVTVQSGHHQAVRRLGDRLRVSATAPDGVVEAVELARPDEGWLLAVQWHPEEPGSPEGQLAALFEPFVEACRYVAAASRR